MEVTMPYWRLHYHLVWATQDRQPFIGPEVESKLYALLVGKADELGIIVHAIGGVQDHVHMIVSIPPKQSVANVVQCLKGASSHNMNEALDHPLFFGWQPGYGALSLGEKQLPAAIAYVREQRIRHRDNTTNRWAEHIAPHDEGPASHPNSRGMREPSLSYSIADEPPF
jgi:putative transposase